MRSFLRRPNLGWVMLCSFTIALGLVTATVAGAWMVHDWRNP